MRDGSRSPRLSWGLLKKDVGWLGVIWAEIDWRWVVPWGFDAQPSHRHRMCMLNTHPSPPSHALAKQVCWLCSHHVCLMFTSKSFSVTPSIFVSRGAPSRLQSTAEGVACATQRATWRGWRLRGPTATLARALGGQWQMPWLQGLVETSWNEIPQIGWPNMTRKGQCIYKAAKRKGNLWWVAHMVPALLSCCWNRSTIYFKKQMTIKPKIYELPHIATVSTAKQKKKTTFELSLQRLTCYIRFYISTRFPNQPHFRRGRLRIFSWKKLQIAPLRRIGWDLSNWKEHQCRQESGSNLEWFVDCMLEYKGYWDVYWVISFNMATWEDLWYFTASWHPTKINIHLHKGIGSSGSCVKCCMCEFACKGSSTPPPFDMTVYRLTMPLFFHWSVRSLCLHPQPTGCLQGRGGTRTCTNTCSSTSTGSGSCGDPAGLEISSRVEWSKRRDWNLELTRWVVLEKDGIYWSKIRVVLDTGFCSGIRMKGVLYMIHRDTASRGTEVPLVHVYFVRSVYTAHIRDMWSDNLCNINSFQP